MDIQSRRGWRQQLKTAAPMVVMILIVAACSSSEDDASATTASRPPSTTTTAATTATNAAPATTATTSSTEPLTSEQAVEVSVVQGEFYRLSADGSVASSVEIYYSSDTSDDRPAVVLLHGWGGPGGTGPAVPLGPMAEEISKVGATVFYFKWHTNGGFNADSAADLSCIGAFVTARAAEYGSDSDRVIVIGHSMGGEAGSKLALSSFELPPSPDCVEVGSAPTPYAFLGIGGSYGMIAQPLEDDPSTFRVRLQPVDNVREIASTEEVTDGMTAAQAYELDGLSALPSSNDLQMVLLVGSNDQYFVTKPSITAAFAEALRDHGTDVEVVEVPDANHENVMYVDTAAGQATLQVISELLSGPT